MWSSNFLDLWKQLQEITTTENFKLGCALCINKCSFSNFQVSETLSFGTFNSKFFLMWGKTPYFSNTYVLGMILCYIWVIFVIIWSIININISEELNFIYLNDFIQNIIWYAPETLFVFLCNAVLPVLCLKKKGCILLIYNNIQTIHQKQVLSPPQQAYVPKLTTTTQNTTIWKTIWSAETINTIIVTLSSTPQSVWRQYMEYSSWHRTQFITQYLFWFITW